MSALDALSLRSPRAAAETVPTAPIESAGRSSFVLAHLSDPHVPMRLGSRSHRLLNKRFFGYLSWRFRRKRVHRLEVLDAMRQDLARLRPDHVAVTGDIVNIALPHEFTRAGEWLRTLGSPDDVTVVPGNHDAYVAVSWDRSWAAWHDFMSSDPEHRGPPATGEDIFPIVRHRGPVALIGLSTAVLTALGLASGRAGKRQLERLGERLRAAADAGLFRVVLLHHPPRAPGSPRHKRLTDARQFAGVIAEAGAELILHGHEHRFRREELAGPEGQVPVFGVPSASMLPQEGGPGAEYHLHHIERAEGGWSLATHVHTFSPETGRFVERVRLHAGAGAPAAGAVLPGSTAARPV